MIALRRLAPLLLLAVLGAATLNGCGSGEEGAGGAQPNAGEARELVEAHEGAAEHAQEGEEAGGEQGSEASEEQAGAGEPEGNEESEGERPAPDETESGSPAHETV